MIRDYLAERIFLVSNMNFMFSRVFNFDQLIFRKDYQTEKGFSYYFLTTYIRGAFDKFPDFFRMGI